MVIAKLFLKDGIRTQNIDRKCLNMDGQKNNSDKTTHLQHWKTNPTKLHLEKGERWEKNWHTVLSKEGKQGPMRQRPDFRDANKLYTEHAESTGEGINPIHSAHQARQNYRQQFKGSEEYNYTVLPRTGWKYYPSTSSSSSSQWQQHDDWMSNQSGDYWSKS